MRDRTPVWQNLDTPTYLIEEALRASGLTWDVESRPLFYPAAEGDDLEYVRFHNHCALIRTDTEQALGTVTSEYIPVGPAQALQVLEDLAEYMDLEIRGMGSLLGGSYIWAVALSTEPTIRSVPDPIYTGCLVIKTYDGQYAHSLYPVMYLPTVQALLKFTDVGYSLSAKQQKKVRFVVHPRFLRTRLEEFFNDFSRVLSVTAHTPLSKEQWHAWLKKMLPKTSSDKKRELSDRFQEDPTVYQALLLTAEYLEYDLPSRRRAAGDRTEAHLYSRWFKTGDRLQSRFLSTHLMRWIRPAKA